MTRRNRTWSRHATLFVGIFLACLGAWAQDATDKTPHGIQSPLPVVVQPSVPYKFNLSSKTDTIEKVVLFARGNPHSATALTPAADGVLILTLDQAQQAAAAASNPLVRLGELQVEAAKQHRLGVQAQYFPAMSTTFFDVHYNKHPGEVLSAGAKQVAVNIINKDSNSLNLIAVQPITPLFSIYQLAKIARADENIARAKAGMPLAQVARNVEETFFQLLVAQWELTGAKADTRKIQAKWLSSSSSGVTSVSAEQETDMINAEKTVIGPASKVKELTASLGAMLGLPEGTKLELVPPDPLVENISLNEATEKATGNSEVIEAEQTAIKAHAGLTATKLQYIPTVGVMGGYAFQNAINLVLPRSFAYIGVSASWTIFDFGKREHGVKEVKAQSEMADLGVQLTKAKVAAAVKNSYFELERSRQFTHLARRMASSARVIEASSSSDEQEIVSARAKLEADMFRAELDYRQAYARLKALMGAQ